MIQNQIIPYWQTKNKLPMTLKDLEDPISGFMMPVDPDNKSPYEYVVTGKFSFQQTSSSDRLCKVIGKKLLNKNKIQISLHDGTNFISQDKISIGDSIYLDKSNKVKKHVSLADNKEVFIISGKYTGLKGKINSIEGSKVGITLDEEKREAQLNKSQVVAL